VFDKSSSGVKVRFEKCSWANPWTSVAADYGDLRVPAFIQLRREKVTQHQGGVEFNDCYVYDNAWRPALAADEETTDFGLSDVHGLITVRNPAFRPAKLGRTLSGVDVKLVKQP
jgi:hypothetical protein